MSSASVIASNNCCNIDEIIDILRNERITACRETGERCASEYRKKSTELKEILKNIQGHKSQLISISDIEEIVNNSNYVLLDVNIDATVTINGINENEDKINTDVSYTHVLICCIRKNIVTIYQSWLDYKYVNKSVINLDRLLYYLNHLDDINIFDKLTDGVALEQLQRHALEIFQYNIAAGLTSNYIDALSALTTPINMTKEYIKEALRNAEKYKKRLEIGNDTIKSIENIDKIDFIEALHIIHGEIIRVGFLIDEDKEMPIKLDSDKWNYMFRDLKIRAHTFSSC